MNVGGAGVAFFCVSGWGEGHAEVVHPVLLLRSDVRVRRSEFVEGELLESVGGAGVAFCC